MKKGNEESVETHCDLICYAQLFFCVEELSWLRSIECERSQHLYIPTQSEQPLHYLLAACLISVNTRPQGMYIWITGAGRRSLLQMALSSFSCFRISADSCR